MGMLSELLVYLVSSSFWFSSSSIKFVNTYAQNHCHLVSWPPLRCLLLALETRVYAESSPVTCTDNASYFGDSWLNISASTADFPKYMFSEAALLLESRSSRRDC